MSFSASQQETSGGGGGGDDEAILSWDEDQGGSADSHMIFHSVDESVLDGVHAWQSEPSSLSYDTAMDALRETATAYSSAKEAEAHRVVSVPLATQRRTAETRYAPGLSSFLSLDGRTGAENVRSALITLPPISIATASALLNGQPVELYLGDDTQDTPVTTTITLYSQDGSSFVDEPESDDAIDPLELVVPWLPPALLADLADHALRGADQVYLGSHGGASLVVLPHGIDRHWAVWQRALLDPMNRVWRLAYVRLARVADRYNRPFCYQLVASSWREQYALVMRMYTHVSVMLRHPLDVNPGGFKWDAVLHRRRAEENLFSVDSLVPNTLCAVGTFGMTMVVDTRAKPAVVTVAQNDLPLRRTLQRMSQQMIVVRSMGAVSFAVALRLVNMIGSWQVVVQRLNLQFDELLLNNARPGNVLLDNEIELLWISVSAPPTRVRVGTAVRMAMGEPDPRAYGTEWAALLANNVDGGGSEAALDTRMLASVGRSRIQVYVVAPDEAYPLTTGNSSSSSSKTNSTGADASLDDHRRLVDTLHMTMRHRVVRQHVLAPLLCDVQLWKQYVHQELWSDFDTYQALNDRASAHSAFDVNRAITVRVLFEAQQLASPQHRDTCVIRPVASTAGFLGTHEERQSPLRTSLLFVGSSHLRNNLHDDVTVQLLPSSCVHSYLALYSNGLSNTHRDMSHAHRAHPTSLVPRALNTYLSVASAYELAGERERTINLLTRSVGPTDRPVLSAEEWAEQVEPPPPNNGDPNAPLLLYDDTLAQEVHHVRPWPADFVPSIANNGDGDDSSTTNPLFSLMAQIERRVQTKPNRALYGPTSFYQDVRSAAAGSVVDGKRHVRFGLWLDGLHPRPGTMQDNMRSAVLVDDPQRVLMRHGVDTLRVMVYVNYRDAQGRRFANAPPSTMVYSLQHDSVNNRMVALPYAGDPVLNAHDWLGEQPLLVHGSTVDTNAPGLMLSKKLGSMRL